MTDHQKQCLLAYFGCLEPEGIDGRWGPESARATARLQQAMQIPADGIWGPETKAAVLRAMEKEQPGTPAGQGFWEHIRHWTREEFRCRCAEYHEAYCDGFPAEPDPVLVELVDDLRHGFGAPGYRSSGLRCSRHNAQQGGVENSRHLQGKALDFMIRGVSGQALLERAKQDPRTRYAYVIGNGPYVHVDVE